MNIIQENEIANSLHEDIYDEMVEVLSKLEGKWDWNDHTYKTTISLSDVALNPEKTTV